MKKEKILGYKTKLEKEKVLLEEELKSVGVENPADGKEWEAKSPEEDIDQADRNEVADEIEDYENNIAILRDLKIKYEEVTDALKKIENGTFGVCEISGEQIEEDRLDANPGARTCKAHMHNK